MILHKARKTIAEKKLLEDGDRILAGVSGGPDSMALLHILAGLRKFYDIEVFAAHLNHMLRGKAADGDAAFVKEAAGDLGIVSVIEKVDVEKLAKSAKMSIEEAARKARYDFFARRAAELGANKIATGHTFDDQAETVLMRLLKGSGSIGLSGMPYKRMLNRLWIVRPLMDITREEIEKYLKKNKIPSRTDASNLETAYFRNRVRNILIPIIEKEFNPKIKENLCATALTLRDESSYLADAASKRLKRISRPVKSGVELPVEDFVREHVAIQRLMTRQVISSMRGGLKGITYRHWKGIEAILHGDAPKRVSLPGGMRVVKNKENILFETRGCGMKDNRVARWNPVALKVPGEAVIPELGMRLKAEEVKSCPDFAKKQDKNVEYVDGTLINRRLTARPRMPGDRISPLGAGYRKKLHDVFIDGKVPLERRDRTPVLLSGKKILWAAGVMLSDEFKIKAGAKKIIKLSVSGG